MKKYILAMVVGAALLGSASVASAGGFSFGFSYQSGHHHKKHYSHSHYRHCPPYAYPAPRARYYHDRCAPQPRHLYYFHAPRFRGYGCW